MDNFDITLFNHEKEHPALAPGTKPSFPLTFISLNPIKILLALTPLHSHESWVLKRFSNSRQITQLVSGGAGVWIQTSFTLKSVLFHPFLHCHSLKEQEGSHDNRPPQEIDVPLPSWIVAFYVMVQLLKFLELVISRERKSTQNPGSPVYLLD